MTHFRKLDSLSGYHLQAHDGEIGKLIEVYFDDRYWIARYFVVRTGSWLLGQKVLILPAMVTGIDDANRSLEVNLSREQVKNSPPVNTENPVSRHYEQQYFAYYGGEPYWHGNPLFGPVPTMPPPVTVMEPEEPEHPHLRSSDEVNGYEIQAGGKAVGKVRDLIIAEPSWALTCMVVDTGRWLSGKKVLLATDWIEGVDWAKKQITVSIDADLLESAPECASYDKIDTTELERLSAHYGKAKGPKLSAE